MNRVAKSSTVKLTLAVALGMATVAASLLTLRYMEVEGEHQTVKPGSVGNSRQNARHLTPEYNSTLVPQPKMPQSSGRKQFSASMSGASESVRPNVAPESAATALGGQSASRSTNAPTDGVDAASAIDWEALENNSPIPRSIPSRWAADAIDAGFPPDWFEHVYGDISVDSLIDHLKVSTVKLLPLVEKITSQSKSPGDVWANRAEADLRGLIQEHATPGTDLITRVFCSEPGCLVYLEGSRPSLRPMKKVLEAWIVEPRTSEYGVRPINIYRAGKGNWDLLIIDRPR